MQLLELRRDASLKSLRNAGTHADLVKYQTAYNISQETIDLIKKT